MKFVHQMSLLSPRVIENELERACNSKSGSNKLTEQGFEEAVMALGLVLSGYEISCIDVWLIYF